MAFTYKTLGQQAPAAATPADLYTAPAATSAIVEGVTVCNRDSAATTIRVSVSVAGAATATKDYICFDMPIPGNTTVILNAVATLAATDKMRVQSASGLVSFSAFGVEIT